MAGGNRRVRRPSLPPELAAELEAQGLAEANADESAPPDPAEAPAPKKKAPSVRLARVGSALRTIAGAALVLGTSCAVAWVARRYVTQSPRFAITEIVVSGNARRTSEQLADEAGITKGANVFTLDLDEAHAALERDPWLSEVTVARRLPGTILVQVKEREAAALVSLGETYLVSREGEIFKRLQPGDPADLPIITGLDPDSVTRDRPGVERSVLRALDLAGDYAASPLAARAELEEIHLAADGTTSLVVGKKGMQLALGKAPFRKKLEQADRVLRELEHRGAKADAILLDNETRPEQVVVRVR